MFIDLKEKKDIIAEELYELVNAAVYKKGVEKKILQTINNAFEKISISNYKKRSSRVEARSITKSLTVTNGSDDDDSDIISYNSNRYTDEDQKKEVKILSILKI